MEIILSFLLSVMAEIVGYYVCKWLDGRKGDNQPNIKNQERQLLVFLCLHGHILSFLVTIIILTRKNFSTISYCLSRHSMSRISLQFRCEPLFYASSLPTICFTNGVRHSRGAPLLAGGACYRALLDHSVEGPLSAGQAIELRSTIPWRVFLEPDGLA